MTWRAPAAPPRPPRRRRGQRRRFRNMRPTNPSPRPSMSSHEARSVVIDGSSHSRWVQPPSRWALRSYGRWTSPPESTSRQPHQPNQGHRRPRRSAPRAQARRRGLLHRSRHSPYRRPTRTVLRRATAHQPAPKSRIPLGSARRRYRSTATTTGLPWRPYPNQYPTPAFSPMTCARPDLRPLTSVAVRWQLGSCCPTRPVSGSCRFRSCIGAVIPGSPGNAPRPSWSPRLRCCATNARLTRQQCQ